MKRIIISYACNSEENRNAFYDALIENSVGVKSRNEKGCLGYSYYFPADDKTSLLLIEQWESDEALERHKAEPHFLFLQELKEKFNITTNSI